MLNEVVCPILEAPKEELYNPPLPVVALAPQLYNDKLFAPLSPANIEPT